MKHAEKRQAGKYVPAFSWHKSIRAFLNEVVTERPLLNVCSGPVDDFGDMRVDAHVKPIPPGVIADWTSLPFGANTYGAVFADPPWNLSAPKYIPTRKGRHAESLYANSGDGGLPLMPGSESRGRPKSTGISWPCQHGSCSACTMLRCEHDCHKRSVA